MEPHPECPSCGRIADTLYEASQHRPSSPVSAMLGLFGELQARDDCDVCQYLALALYPHAYLQMYFPECPVLFIRGVPPYYNFRPLDVDGGMCFGCDGKHPSFAAIQLHSQGPPMFCAAKVDRNWVDLGRIANWISQCDESHGGRCHDFSGFAKVPAPSISRLTLVDVIQQRLVYIQIPDARKLRYVALSYVWGPPQYQENSLESCQGNLQKLQQVGSLAGLVPDTIRDAMGLVKALGLTFLWVDRLCIVQDDLASKAYQVQQMGDIFANAYLTLVAADGDSVYSGLPGSCPGVSEPRDFTPPTMTFRSDHKASSLILQPDFDPLCVWRTRAWTFQEQMLSHRQLIFAGDRVLWVCRVDAYAEELARQPNDADHDDQTSEQVLEISFPPPVPVDQRPEAGRWPDLSRYRELVTKYSTRMVSFPGDYLSAFTGLAMELSRSFPGGFLYSIPEYYFDYALVWTPLSPITRRLVDGKMDPRLPSWSWVGWQGGEIAPCIDLPTAYSSTEALPEGLPRPSLYYWPTTVICKEMEGLEGVDDIRKINNGHHQDMKRKDNPSLPLPDGWSRDQDIFIHAECPRWKFTWPVNMLSKPLLSLETRSSPYLRFGANRAFLHIGTQAEGYHAPPWASLAGGMQTMASSFHLRDEPGNWVGLVRCNQADYSGADPQERCEFIVVSGGTHHPDPDYRPGPKHVSSVFDEMAHFDEVAQANGHSGNKPYDFYNVLWIYRVEGIAYRKAVGIVWCPAWDRLATEEVHIKLG
ncbi:heterokaryon incompatibility protein-domain-containing protein [Xylariomycetidae sp. FL0641]|nr:heterokaryon incompatibility protein-domain-containing protein [Xylariomycetidae sp. FL0641]